MNNIRQTINFLIEAGKLGNIERKLHATQTGLYAKAIDKLQSQFVVYSHLMTNPNYQYITESTVSEHERLIWSYVMGGSLSF